MMATVLAYFFLGDLLLRTNKIADALHMAWIGLGLAGFLAWLLNDGINKSEKSGKPTKEG